MSSFLSNHDPIALKPPLKVQQNIILAIISKRMYIVQNINHTINTMIISKCIS